MVYMVYMVLWSYMVMLKMIHFNCSNLFILYSTQFVVIEMKNDEVPNLKVFNNPLINS